MLTTLWALLDGLAQPDQHLAIELENVPVQPVRGPDRVVREPVHRLHTQHARPDMAEHHPPAGGTKINSCHPAGHTAP